MRPRRSWLAVGSVVVLLVGPACSDRPGSAGRTSLPTVAASLAPSMPSLPSSPSASGTGVPGLDDPDPFCAAWAAYGGTLQALSVASAFGNLDAAALARLEVIAAPALVDAVTGIGGRWPSELLTERSLVLADLVGPFGRRAQKAVQALEAAGAQESELSELASLWTVALRTRRDDRPVPEVPGLAGTLETVVGSAAASFDAAVTPFGEDPSLIVDMARAPATSEYLATTCPDVASSGVGDRL